MTSSCSTSIMKEVKKLMRKPLNDIEILIKNDNILILNAIVSGPESTPFENGKFEIELHFKHNYPQQPPKGYFITKIFHPNVAPSNGEICVNTLKKDWKPSYGIKHILIAIRSLLIVPNYDSALNEEAGKLLLTSYQHYVERARLFTKIHSIKKKPIIKDTDVCYKNDDDDDGGTNNRQIIGDKENVHRSKECDKNDKLQNRYLNENENEKNKENNGNTKYDENNHNNKNKSKSKSKSKSKKSKVSKSMRRL